MNKESPKKKKKVRKRKESQNREKQSVEEIKQLDIAAFFSCKICNVHSLRQFFERHLHTNQTQSR